MNYHSKSYSLDDDVVALMDGLKAKFGSYNKGLRATLLDGLAVPAPCGHGAEMARLTAENVELLEKVSALEESLVAQEDRSTPWAAVGRLRAAGTEGEGAG